MSTVRNEIATQPADVRAVFQLAWPVMVSMLSYTTMSVIDTLYIARLGTDELAAIGLAMVAVFTSQSFGVGLMAGVRVMCAQFTGAGAAVAGFAGLEPAVRYLLRKSPGLYQFPIYR